MKFSKAERAGLYLTAGVLLFFAGWALRDVLGGDSYTLSGSRLGQLSPSPAAQVFVPDERLDINTATLNELMGLPGIGRTRAQAIVDHRDTQGPFAYPEDLMEVPGIGPSIYEGLADYITTSD